MNNWLEPYKRMAILSPQGNIIFKMSWSYCRRCGRMLKTDEARERGYGKICWEKAHNSKQSSLF